MRLFSFNLAKDNQTLIADLIKVGADCAFMVWNKIYIYKKDFKQYTCVVRNKEEVKEQNTGF